MEGQVFEKQPGEVRKRGPDYSGKLDSGVTVASATVAAVNMETGDPASGVITGGAIVTGGYHVTTTCQGGESGTTYKITFTVTLSNGEILEDEMIMRVRER